MIARSPLGIEYSFTELGYARDTFVTSFEQAGANVGWVIAKVESS